MNDISGGANLDRLQGGRIMSWNSKSILQKLSNRGGKVLQRISFAEYCNMSDQLNGRLWSHGEFLLRNGFPVVDKQNQPPRSKAEIRVRYSLHAVYHGFFADVSLISQDRKSIQLDLLEDFSPAWPLVKDEGYKEYGEADSDTAFHHSPPLQYDYYSDRIPVEDVERFFLYLRSV